LIDRRVQLYGTADLLSTIKLPTNLLQEIELFNRPFSEHSALIPRQRTAGVFSTLLHFTQSPMLQPSNPSQFVNALAEADKIQNFIAIFSSQLTITFPSTEAVQC